MTCSSNTISTPDPLRRAAAPRRAGLAAALLLALCAPVHAAPPGDPAALVRDARADIVRGDGVAAEIRLKRALAAGAPRRAIAAYMGEALRLQDKHDQALGWLAGGAFSATSAADGFRTLGRLHQAKRDFPASARAFDRALALIPGDAGLWVEIARMRHAGGEHLLAIEAAEYALSLDQGNARALALYGQIVRDRGGLVPALAVFERALTLEPEDLAVLGDYAATLGDLGRAREMLAATRRILALDPGNSRALYLQAVMAARAGDHGLARRLLNRTGGRLNDLPGAMLLDGVLHLAAHNPTLAADRLERLVALQPGNERARILLARALFLGGRHDEVVARFAGEASEPASPVYLKVLLARSHEALGQRDRAAPLLNAAGGLAPAPVRILRRGSDVGAILAEGRTEDARAHAAAALAANPGHFDHLARAGDAELAAARARDAITYYERAARIRSPDSLMRRRVQALLMAGEGQEAARLVSYWLAGNPASRNAQRLAGLMSALGGDWDRARFFLKHLHETGGEQDVQLLADLSLAQVRSGDDAGARASAAAAYRVQRSSLVATQALALALAGEAERRPGAVALIRKAEAMGADRAVLDEARRRLSAAAGS